MAPRVDIKMSLDRIELHNDAFDALRKSPEVLGDLMNRGQQIADAATAGSPDGAEYIVEDISSSTRARVRVVTGNIKARAGEGYNAALTRALDAGRG